MKSGFVSAKSEKTRYSLELLNSNGETFRLSVNVKGLVGISHTKFGHTESISPVVYVIECLMVNGDMVRLVFL